MTKEEMVASVKEQLKLWAADSCKFAFNTGPQGRVWGGVNYSEFTTKVTAEDFKAACAELSEFVRVTYTEYRGRYARSLSGAEYNIWSFLAEPGGEGTRKLNYHILVEGKV